MSSLGHYVSGFRKISLKNKFHMYIQSRMAGRVYWLGWKRTSRRSTLEIELLGEGRRS